MDAPRDFLFIFLFFYFFIFLSERAARGGGEGGGGGSALPDFFFSFFPCSADHERDWPPCKVVFFGLATNALNVRNNKKQQQTLPDDTCVAIPTVNPWVVSVPTVITLIL